ncbi:CDP-alcohol phosphatidyltransferase family protein [Actinomadura rupiterrae]|uniref:CDP-alcohol phosphatidyltransferase family protein n=1 Tax=Actinomadura rupiterrae TaxID=559627 RepID=UPI0020A5B71F|nr:CDP-alcohol phosphatidyltransferase family protein [Actinomadura rupiterrae]MCP2335374.1 hypothetical protein [Actinomadura rupiterrae]
MTLAVIVATGRTAGPEPVPTAALPTGDGGPSVLTRLVGRLGALGVESRLITRPDLAPRLRKDGHDPVECDGTAADLREIARLVHLARTAVVLLPADLVISDEQLARLVLDAAPHPATAATVRPAGGPSRPVRVDAGRVAAAGSAFHRVTAPTADFPGALCIGEQRTVQAAEVAEKLAALLELPGALPPPAALPTAPEYDAIELMLVGLVRAGVPVQAQPVVQEFVCRRVWSEDTAQEAVKTAQAADEDRIRLRAAVKKDDGWFATYAVGSWSPLLVRCAAALDLTPNAVTGISTGLAAVAAFAFASGARTGMVAGAVLLYLSFVLDCVDGQLARYTRAFSPFGAWLDATLDRVKEFGVYAGLAVGASAAALAGRPHTGDVWALAAAALVLQTVRHMIDFSFADRPRPVAMDAGGAPPAGADTPSAPLTVADDPVPAVPQAPSAPPEGRSARYWARRIVVLPIGERFALISVTAALGTARLTFAALLGWGGVAACYTLTGRVMRAIRR